MRKQRMTEAQADELIFGIVEPPELDEILEEEHHLADTITESQEVSENDVWH